MRYMTIMQASQMWSISPRRVEVLCATGRIPNTVRFGKAWAIPSDATKPYDARIKSGKYRKKLLTSPEPTEQQ